MGRELAGRHEVGETAKASYMDGGSNNVGYMDGYALIDPAKPPTTIAVLPAGAHYLEYVADGRFDPDGK